MPELLVLCNPDNVYRGREEEDVAEAYIALAMDYYNRLVTFHKQYEPFSEMPDFECVAGYKGGRRLVLTLFAQQQVAGVGEADGPLTSSSYFFNPCSDEGLLLPDLDVIQIEGASAKDAAITIEKFYKGHGWRVYVFDGDVDVWERVKPSSERFNHKIEIISPNALRDFARQRVGYRPFDLCF